MMSNAVSSSNCTKRKAFEALQEDSSSLDANDRASDSSPDLHPATDTSGSDSSNSNKPNAFTTAENRSVKSKKSIWDSIPSASADLVKPGHFGLCEFPAVKEDGFKKPIPPSVNFAQTLTALAAQVQQSNIPLQMPSQSHFLEPPSAPPVTTDVSHHIMELLKNATKASLQASQEQQAPSSKEPPIALKQQQQQQPISIGSAPLVTQAPKDPNVLNRLSRENIDLVQTLIALSSNPARTVNSTVTNAINRSTTAAQSGILPSFIMELGTQQAPIAPAVHGYNDKDIMSGSFPMATDTDDERMSSYQIMVRQQLEFFIADKKDVESSTQGRKKPVILGQVGIRCKHCSHIPQRKRVRGAVYFPTKLDGVYQAAQNMSTTHLLTSCEAIDEFARKKLLKLKETKLIAMAGKQEWAEACRKMGIYEVEGGGLRMIKPTATLANC